MLATPKVKIKHIPFKHALFHNKTIEQLPTPLFTSFNKYYPGIKKTPFIKRLTEGHLSRHSFNHFLEQDQLYLYYWCQLWNQLSTNINSEYKELLLSIKTISIKEKPNISPTPNTYKSIVFLHLLSTLKNPTLELFGLSSCFILYFYITKDIANQINSKHPYKEWIDIYSSENREIRTQNLVFTLNNLLLAENDKNKEIINRITTTATYLDWKFLEQF